MDSDGRRDVDLKAIDGLTAMDGSSTAWLAMLGFVSVGSTPQRQTCLSVADMSKISYVGQFLAFSVVSVRPFADTHSCMGVGISTNEVVTYEDKKNWNVYHLFFILSDFHPLKEYTTL